MVISLSLFLTQGWVSLSFLALQFHFFLREQSHGPQKGPSLVVNSSLPQNSRWIYIEKNSLSIYRTCKQQKIF
ncbi:hypothetical protein AMTRI_Chr01g112220 [Amborella trichopoda]